MGFKFLKLYCQVVQSYPQSTDVAAAVLDELLGVASAWLEQKPAATLAFGRQDQMPPVLLAF